MEFWKRPVFRVPLVLMALGVVCRIVSFFAGYLWGSYLHAQGPDPETGIFYLSAGPTTAIMILVSCLLFWWAGWRFVRGLSRRQVFLSASIMTAISAVLLAAEQIAQAMGNYPMWLFHLYSLAEGSQWVMLLLAHLFNAGISTAVVSIFAPYLYLIFAKKNVPIEGNAF